MRGFWRVFDDRRSINRDMQGRPYTWPREVLLYLWGDWSVILPVCIRFSLWNWMFGFPKGQGVKPPKKESNP